MFYSRFAPAFSAGMLALCLAASAHADSLTGTTIAQTAAAPHGGTSVNAPSASASVGAGIEFTNVFSVPGFFDLNIYQDFSDAGLTIGISTPASGAQVTTADSVPLLTLTYTDSAFTGPYAFQSYSCAANAFCDTTPGSDYSTLFSGSTLTVNFFALEDGQTYTFAPSATTAATPEPGSLALTLTGLLGAAGIVRRRLFEFASA